MTELTMIVALYVLTRMAEMIAARRAPKWVLGLALLTMIATLITLLRVQWP